MIKTKNKIITVGVLFVVLLLITGFQGFNRTKGFTSANIETMGELAGKNLGGVVAKMPENSAKIFFETLLGQKLSSYHAYDNLSEVIAALRMNEIQVAWTSDVTAEYLLKTQEGLHEITTPDSSDDRLDFAFAIKQGREDFRQELNEALTSIKEDGTLENLLSTYVDTEIYETAYYEKDMTIKQKEYQGTPLNKTVYVGVTGAVPPLDNLDLENKPFGFSVALMDAIGQTAGFDVEFVVMKNEAAFSNLMSGKIDMIFCYGTSKNTVSPESSYPYIMTDGYYKMNKYSYLVLE